MSIDILNMARFELNDHAIDVALPVLAIECEATPPLENFLDAYEDTVLKLVALGLSTTGISKTMNATESLIDEVLTHLEAKEYAERVIGKPWKLTEDGEKYLNGSIEERASAESQYGFMFINAIKKEVLPFFLKGDVGQISLFRGQPLPLKLTINGDEDQTFDFVNVKNSKLKKAYSEYLRRSTVSKDYDEGLISKDEAIDLFADLESFDEESDEETDQGSNDKTQSSSALKKKMFIRALHKKPVKLYLRMRIIIDPSHLGGYRVESPFDFGGIDNDDFLMQIQWLEQSDKAYLNGELMRDFLHREICKLSPSYKTAEKDYQVFILEKVPLLKLYRSRFPYIYEDMERIYALVQRQNSLLEKENIVSPLSRYVVERLFNVYFRSIDQEKLHQIQQKAFDDVTTYGYVAYKKQLCRNAHLDEDALRWVDAKYLNTIIGRLSWTYGNSIMEKFINMLVIEFHWSDVQIHKFLFQPDIEQKYSSIDKLNRIRRKVSHDTNDTFTNADYNYYMSNVYGLISNLLDALMEE